MNGRGYYEICMPRDLSVNLHITDKIKAMLCGFCTAEMLVDHRLGVNKCPLSLRPVPPTQPCLPRILVLCSTWAAPHSSSDELGLSLSFQNACVVTLTRYLHTPFRIRAKHSECILEFELSEQSFLQLEQGASGR